MILDKTSWVWWFFSYFWLRFFYFKKHLIRVCVSDSKENEFNIIDIVFWSAEVIVCWLGKCLNLLNSDFAHYIKLIKLLIQKIKINSQWNKYLSSPLYHPLQIQILLSQIFKFNVFWFEQSLHTSGDLSDSSFYILLLIIKVLPQFINLLQQSFFSCNCIVSISILFNP